MNSAERRIADRRIGEVGEDGANLERHKLALLEEIAARLRALTPAKPVAGAANDGGHPALNGTSAGEQPTAAELRDLREELRQVRESLERQRHRQHAAPSPIDAAVKAAVREVVREETAGALAAHRAEERTNEAAKLLPLPEAADYLGISKKALRSRIERGSVPGATKIGERWHVPLAVHTTDNS